MRSPHCRRKTTTPNFKGLVWWQGESGTRASALADFIAAVRSLLAAAMAAIPMNFRRHYRHGQSMGLGLEAWCRHGCYVCCEFRGLRSKRR